MNKRMTPVKFRALVQKVYDEAEKEAGTLLPIHTVSEYTKEDNFTRKNYKGLRVMMYEQQGIRVQVYYAHGYTRVDVSSGNSLHSWRKWEVNHIRDFSRVLSVAATILEQAKGDES